MLSSQRIFVEALKRYCARHAIDIEVRSQGWLIVMHRDQKRHFAFGYDIGLNSAMAHRIANDKAAAAEVLQLSGVPSIPHHIFLSPQLNARVAGPGSSDGMLRLLSEHAGGIVVKPNEGSSGRSVFLVRTRPQLELAASTIFSSHPSLAISPYVEVEQEVRLVMLDGRALAVYAKQRPTVTGDGQRSLLELALAATPIERRSVVLPALMQSTERSELDAVLPAGETRLLNWRHNLDAGAEPVLLEDGEAREACVQIAIRAAAAIDIRFASVDLVRVAGSWRVLEINSGVMMESLGRRRPDLVEAVYAAALDRVFG
jgi:D-alanine-D-alanine ligase-like ATP-grasp enzyme